MLKVPDPRRGIARRFGLAAAAMLVLAAATGERAEALSLINPAAAPAAKYASEGLTTEVKGGGGHGGGGHGGGGFHGGGGGGFRGGGFHGGGAAFHGGGFRGGGAVFRGGGYRYGGAGFVGPRHFAPRHAFHHRHFHRRFFASSYYPYYNYYPYCRIVWTYYGPRRVCPHRPGDKGGHLGIGNQRLK